MKFEKIERIKKIAQICTLYIIVGFFFLSMNDVKAEEPNKDTLPAYRTCKDFVISLGQERSDGFFDGYISEVSADLIGSNVSFVTTIGAKEKSDCLWILTETKGTDSSLPKQRWFVMLDGETGQYVIDFPLTFSDLTLPTQIMGSFELKQYSDAYTFTADKVVSEEEIDPVLEEQMASYPIAYIPTSINALEWWLDHNKIGLSLYDLGFELYKPLVFSDNPIDEPESNKAFSKKDSEQKKNTTSTESKKKKTDRKSNSTSNNHSNARDSNIQKGTRTCPNCSGTGWVKTYETNDPWEEPTIIDCPMCRGSGKVTD